MEARTAPREATAGRSSSYRALLRLASDKHLVSLVREGRDGAFEEVYDRHHRQLLSFCRHMLGDSEEAQDAVQHTFLAAYNDLSSSDKSIQLRAWLYTIARNRCYSLLRSRREEPTPDLTGVSTEGLATEVQRRQELREVLFDLHTLPREQRAALVLAELEAMSHDEIGEVLGVRREKVKALIFQARESLMANRVARDTDCAEIRSQLSTLRGGALRRSNLRRHLRQCEGCREYRRQLAHQSRRLALVLPVIPTLALRDVVLSATADGGSGAGVLSGGLLAAAGVKSGGVKLVTGAVLTALGTASTVVATTIVKSAPRMPAGLSSAPQRLAARPPVPLPTEQALARMRSAAATRPLGLGRLTVSALASGPSAAGPNQLTRVVPLSTGQAVLVAPRASLTSGRVSLSGAGIAGALAPGLRGTRTVPSSKMGDTRATPVPGSAGAPAAPGAFPSSPGTRVPAGPAAPPPSTPSAPTPTPAPAPSRSGQPTATTPRQQTVVGGPRAMAPGSRPANPGGRPTPKPTPAPNSVTAPAPAPAPQPSPAPTSGQPR